MKSIEDLSRDQIIRMIGVAFKNIISHTGLWFRETEYQLGIEKALQIDNQAWQRGFPIQIRRLAKYFGLEVDEQGIPVTLKNMGKETLISLFTDLAKNWIANDGVWFQAVEQQEDMFVAKRCNDTAWTRFTVIEAHRIMEAVGIPKNGGLEALKQALGYRLYARLNVQEIVEENENSFLFRMNDCRVQSARKRAGLPDYPCKSGGLVEYSYFARAIDPRIKTTCVGCPPDPHPEEWWCAWRFEIPNP